MAYADFVEETTTTTGTSTYQLGGAVTGRRTFVAGVGNGATVTYACTDGTNWEVGEGTVTDATPDTLSRTFIQASSNGNAAVNWGAGEKQIYLVASAESIQNGETAFGWGNHASAGYLSSAVTSVSAGTGTSFSTITGTGSVAIDKATIADVRSGTSNKVLTADNIEDACDLVSASGGSNLSLDWSSAFVTDWNNLTANRVLNNPTNVEPGTTRYVIVSGNSATARTVTFGSNFKGDIPVLTDITSTKWYLLVLVAYSTSHIIISYARAL